MAIKGMTQEEQDYAAAFDEDMGGPGIDLTAAQGGEPEGMEQEPESVAVVVASEEDLEQSAGQAMADATKDVGSAAPGQEDEGPLDPKEEQRRKSWEGRLRAREEELARREAELKKSAATAAPAEKTAEDASEAIEQAADDLSAQGDDAGAETAKGVAEQVESGELTAEQAMKILAEDFGDDFVKLIDKVATARATEAAARVAQEQTSALGQSVQEIIDDIVDTKAKAHFQQIAAKHPDFHDVASTPEFSEFAKTYENGEQIAESGSAEDIVAMLDAFKAGKQEPEQQNDDAALSAAEGVRSSGLSLPKPPTRSDDYEEAWKDF